METRSRAGTPGARSAPGTLWEHLIGLRNLIVLLRDDSACRVYSRVNRSYARSGKIVRVGRVGCACIALASSNTGTTKKEESTFVFLLGTFLLFAVTKRRTFFCSWRLVGRLTPLLLAERADAFSFDSFLSAGMTAF